MHILSLDLWRNTHLKQGLIRSRLYHWLYLITRSLGRPMLQGNLLAWHKTDVSGTFTQRRIQLITLAYFPIYAYVGMRKRWIQEEFADYQPVLFRQFTRTMKSVGKRKHNWLDDKKKIYNLDAPVPPESLRNATGLA